MPKGAVGRKLGVTVSELGERKVIEILKEHLDISPYSSVPFGDDVAAVQIDSENVAVLKTDMLVDKTDVPLGMSLTQAARKAIIMNVSDFASKGAQPLAALVSLGLPKKLRVGAIIEIAEGLNIGAREYGAYIVGGDTGEASNVVIAVSLYGKALKSQLMLRSGARPGDVIGVTGTFGNPAAGLRMLSEDRDVPKRLQNALLESVFLPKARLQEGLALASSGFATSSIDSSDGLAWSLHELGRMSKVGFLIDHVPIAKEAQHFAECCMADILDLALYGGEEYELVVTVKPDCWSGAEKAVMAVGGRLLRIGEVTKETAVLLEKNGKRRQIDPRGWEHFKSSAQDVRLSSR
jgi:thiamine-monophosphate kinase